MKLTRTLVGAFLLFFGIGLGVMAHTIVNAQEPDEEPEAETAPTAAVLLLCSPDCKVVEETPQDELIAGLEDEIERMRTFITRVDQCIPGNRNICWEGMKDFLLPDFDED